MVTLWFLEALKDFNFFEWKHRRNVSPVDCQVPSVQVIKQ